jgi:hypothetical protein
MISTTLLRLLALIAAAGLLAAAPASGAKSPIKVGVADQSPAMFAAPEFRALKIKRTRYFVPADVMQDGAERARARAFVTAARAAGVSTLLHISTSDLRSKRGPIISTTKYRRDVGRIVAYFRKLGVKDFGAWNEVNHKTQETWNRVGNAVSYFKSMWQAVHGRCPTCAIVGLDVLDQAGVEKYIASFYKRLDSRWRTRLKVVGIHNYSDVNRNRSTGTAKIIKTVRTYNKRTKFWFTETGALASFGVVSVLRVAPGLAHPQHVHVRHALPPAGRRAHLLLQLVRHRARHELRHALSLRRRARRSAGPAAARLRRRPAPGVLRLQGEARELLALSPSARRLLRRSVDERQQRAEARDLEHALDLARAAHDRQGEAVGLGARVGLRERAQAGRVHERQLAQVEHERRARLGRSVRDRLLEHRRRGDVELAGRADVRRPPVLVDADAEGRNRHDRADSSDHE